MPVRLRLFIVPLLTGILLLIPGQGTTALGIEIGVFGLLVGRVLMLLDTDELKGEPRALVVVDRFSPRVLVTVAQVAGGASLIERRFGGLHWLAAAHVGAVLGGLVNAWISDVRPLAACQGDQLGAVWALVRLQRSLPPATAGSRAAMKIVGPAFDQPSPGRHVVTRCRTDSARGAATGAGTRRKCAERIRHGGQKKAHGGPLHRAQRSHVPT